MDTKHIKDILMCRTDLSLQERSKVAVQFNVNENIFFLVNESGSKIIGEKIFASFNALKKYLIRLPNHQGFIYFYKIDGEHRIVFNICNQGWVYASKSGQCRIVSFFYDDINTNSHLHLYDDEDFIKEVA